MERPAPGRRRARTSTLPARQLMDAVTDFLQARETAQGASRHTLAAYRRDLGGLCASLARRGRAVATARAEDLAEHLSSLRRRGLGHRSIARHLSSIRGLYRFLVQSGVVARDPTERLESPRPARRLPRVLPVSDVAALIEAPAL